MQDVENRDVGRLVESCQLGGRDAFDELVRLYQRQAMRIAVGILQDAETAGEAVQEGFVRAYLQINKLRDVKKFRVWLLKIVANEAISMRRTRIRASQVIELSEGHEDKKAKSPLERGISGELNEAIRKAMLKLTKKQAKAISLFGLEGLSNREAAEIMGCSEGALRWHVFKARQKLKVLLKEHL
ncbi:MAG: RNA polymerase sigma factor [Planctomycetota bacterium]|jgi:RNA polymerase sigma-70 factor (ECF subfamily)